MLDRTGSVSTSALAERLGVTAASATAMIKRLAGVGLVRHEPYHGVSLTEAGTQAALEVIRHHRLLELYLMQALGLSWDEVHAEAERLEHHLSETLEARIDAALGHPDARSARRSDPDARARAGRRRRPPAERARARRRGRHPARARTATPRSCATSPSSASCPDERVVMVGHAPVRRPAHGRGRGRAPRDLARARRAHPHRGQSLNPPVRADLPAVALPGEQRVLEAAQRSLAERRGGLRGLWPFLGPAFIAAIAYVDPGNFATNIAVGLAVRLPAALGHPRLEPDGDADPDDEREARHRDRRQPRRDQRASASRIPCASSSGSRPRRSRWPATSPSSSAPRSASTCSSACRSCPPGCSRASSRSRSWPPSCAACGTSRPSSPCSSA